MNIAILVSKRRKNIKHQAGACIVNSSNRIIGTGNYTYNSHLKDELLSWFKEPSMPKNDYCKICNYSELIVFNVIIFLK